MVGDRKYKSAAFVAVATYSMVGAGLWRGFVILDHDNFGANSGQWI